MKAHEAPEPLRLENSRLGLHFNQTTGSLEAVQNRLTAETYRVTGDTFALEAVGFAADTARATPVSIAHDTGSLQVRYLIGGATVDVAWTLDPVRHYAEKRVVLAFDRPCALKTVVLGRPAFRAEGLRILCYRYPKFGRDPGQEPTCTFFGRTTLGGFFTGMEVPFDASTIEDRTVTLAYAPSLKVDAGEPLACEPAYLGVYRRSACDVEGNGPAFRRSSHFTSTATVDGLEELPLSSESAAMTAMASAILGPRRFGLVPMVCTWHSEMEHRTYTEASVEADLRALDCVAECGIDWASDSHPWGGETEKMNRLGAADRYEPGPRVRHFLEHARAVGVKVTMWPTMNMTHPFEEWALPKAGAEVRDLSAPLRADEPKWLMRSSTRPSFGNCLANRPYREWLTRVNLEGMATGLYAAWCMDGSFFGDGGTVQPVDCQSDLHDHLPGDSNYACQRALADLTAAVRRRFPHAFLFMCRPPQDLGIWALRNVDACFTLLESGTGSSNLAGGDSIRTWARVRLHRDFQPHWLDQPLLFPSHQEGQSDWSGDHLDYILLSALSCSPNQLFYLPARSGIPAADRSQIRRWLDWGRHNVEYLLVRRDLPCWPAEGTVDGSAHIVGGRGLVFLFNPGQDLHEGEFSLTREGIGLESGTSFRIGQEHPASDRTLEASHGEDVRWPVPGHGVVVLRITPTA